MNVNLYMIRHGESEANLDTSEYSRTPDSEIKLTPFGRLQAVDARIELNWDLATAIGMGQDGILVCTSPYERALATADIIHSGLDFEAEFHVLDILRERKLGSLIDEVEWEHILDPLQRGIHPKLAWNYRPIGGESYVDVYYRALEFYKGIMEHCRENNIQHVIIVSHYVVIQTLMLIIDDLSPEDWASMEHVENGEIHYRYIDV